MSIVCFYDKCKTFRKNNKKNYFPKIIIERQERKNNDQPKNDTNKSIRGSLFKKKVANENNDFLKQ